MDALIAKISAYKKATQTLINSVEELEDRIKNEVPFEFWPDMGLRLTGGDRFGSWHFRINGKVIPPTTEKFGKSFYWGNDFNYGYDYCNGKELVEFSKNIPSLIDELEQKIVKITNSID